MLQSTLTVVAVAMAAACTHADLTPHQAIPIHELAYESLSAFPQDGQIAVSGLTIDGRPAELELERFSVHTSDTRIIIAGADGEREAQVPIVLFRGWMHDDPESTVVLAVTPWWTQGFVSTAHDTHYISTGRPNAQGHGTLRITAASEMPVGGIVPDCGVVLPAGAAPLEDLARPGVARSGPPPCRTARVAFDTDYAYTQRFGGDALEGAAYALLLTAAGSEIYRRDLNVRLVASYIRVWEDNSDPYPGSGDSLTQFQDHWRVNQFHIDRDFAILLTGRTNLPYGGVAELNSLCSDYRGFGVVGYVRGSFPYPIVDQHAGNQDLVYFAHEAGHIFGTLHTHDGYSPPIDNCGIGDCSQPISTIMSYCQLCSGGFRNIQLRFHPRVIEAILNDLENFSCDLTGDQLVAVDDDIFVYSDRSRPLDPLSNDIATPCEPASAVIAWATPVTPAGATVEIMPPESPYPHTWLRYTAPTDYEGPDTIEYTLTNGTSATMHLTVLRVRHPVFTGPVVPGVRVSYYHVPSPMVMPDLDTLVAFHTEIVTSIDFPPGSGGTFAGSGLDANLAARFEGYFLAGTEGRHLFGVYSDDGAQLTVHDNMILNMNQVQDFDGFFAPIELRPGAHPVRIDYFQFDGPAALRVWWALVDPYINQTVGGGISIIGSNRWRAPDPCPADIDDNGTVDFFDLAQFVNDFHAGDPNTDHHPDGVLNFFDISAFLQAFNAGCP